MPQGNVVFMDGIFTLVAEEELDGMSPEVLGEVVVLRRLVLQDLRSDTIRRAGSLVGKMANKDASRELILVRIGSRAALRGAEMLKVAEENDVKVASSLGQVAQKLLHCIDSVQELEAIWGRKSVRDHWDVHGVLEPTVKVDLGLLQAVPDEGLAMDGKELAPRKFADDIDGQRPKGSIPGKEPSALLILVGRHCDSARGCCESRCSMK